MFRFIPQKEVRTTESSSPSDSDDVVEFRPLTYDDDVNNTDEVVCHYNI